MGVEQGQPTSGAGRHRWWWAAVAVAVVVVALVAGIAGLGSGDDDTTATDPDASASVTPSPSETSEPSEEPSDQPTDQPTDDAGEPEGDPHAALQVAPQQGRCMVPEASSLADWPVAFRGTVTRIDRNAGLVLLQVKHWYAAEGFGGTDTIMVKRPDDGFREAGLTFERGETYLIAASEDAEVALCGFSGPVTPELTTLYQQAFG